MCKLVTSELIGNNGKIAEIKKSAIENIIVSAPLCDSIARIVLFGSCTKERCNEKSDIDIAVFGKTPKNKCLSSSSYRKFISELNSFNDYAESYDVLYFQDGKVNNSSVMDDINEGVLIYASK